MVYLKTTEEIQLMRESSRVLAQTHGEIARLIKPGVKTKALDRRAEEFIRDNKGIPSFLDYNSFPASLCISVNDVVVHGFPGEYELRNRGGSDARGLAVVGVPRGLCAAPRPLRPSLDRPRRTWSRSTASKRSSSTPTCERRT